MSLSMCGGCAGSNDDMGGTTASCEELFGIMFSESARFRKLKITRPGGSKSVCVKPQAAHPSPCVQTPQPDVVPQFVTHMQVHAG